MYILYIEIPVVDPAQVTLSINFWQWNILTRIHTPIKELQLKLIHVQGETTKISSLTLTGNFFYLHG